MLKIYIDKNEMYLETKILVNTTQGKTDVASIPKASHPLILLIMTTTQLG